MGKKGIFIIPFFIAVVLYSCESKNNKGQEDDYMLSVPTVLGDSLPQPNFNRITRDGVTLGRYLFYDPILSANNQVACASCHIQAHAFADTVALSKIGMSNNQLERNAPALQNLAWHPGYFWDGGNTSLELQALGPLTHTDEMGKDLRLLLDELKNNKTYKQLFKNAFHTDTISIRMIAYALAQFERTLISGNAKYDEYLMNNKNTDILGEKAHNGLMLFKKHCSSCHIPGHFTDYNYHNNGLKEDFSQLTSNEDPKWGRYRITLDSADIGKYKTPSLRNVALTAPYMHDGRFATLEEVLQFYSRGINDHYLTDTLLYFEGNPGFNLSEAEQKNIIAFLQTLTDSVFIRNPDLSNPYP